MKWECAYMTGKLATVGSSMVLALMFNACAHSPGPEWVSDDLRPLTEPAVEEAGLYASLAFGSSNARSVLSLDQMRG